MSSRLAGVQQDVVHVGLHNVRQVVDSQRIRLAVELEEAFGLAM